ncbi:MAG: pectate lyase [Planctomycetes bacterium]|nr:pectate lyase [Planctomycetota bacterium]
MKLHGVRRWVVLWIAITSIGAATAVTLAGEDGNVAENVLLYQRNSGGWPKNYDRDRELTDADKARLLADKERGDSTFDNGATHSEVRLLARAYQATGDERFKRALLRGVEFMLRAQYENGGWAQSYPNPGGYSRHITFNDGAMIGAMTTLRDIAGGTPPYDFVDRDLRARAGVAVEKGIRCVLACQIVVDGKRTAWCAQHDEETLVPRKARSYELASLSGGESVGIVRFLMDIDQPGPEVIAAVEGAVAWFDAAKLQGIRQVTREDKSQPRGMDKIVIPDPSAPPMWARFHEIGTNRPIFCSRDGVPKRTLAEISYERRTGYSWLGYYAADLLEKDYPAWRKKWTPDRNVIE